MCVKISQAAAYSQFQLLIIVELLGALVKVLLTLHLLVVAGMSYVVQLPKTLKLMIRPLLQLDGIATVIHV